MTDRTILIGDLHGCYDEAVELLKKCKVTANDWVIFLGDYVDRGPDNDKCCDLVRHREQVQGRVAGILGNHEEKHLKYEDNFSKKDHAAQRKEDQLPERIPPTHVATRSQLRPEHYDWFRSLPLYVRILEHNAVAVHAGVFPGRSIEEQKAMHLLHIQMIRPFNFDCCGNVTINEKTVWPSRVPNNEDGWKFWTHFWDGPEFIIFGHSCLDRPLITDKVAGIDGGAVFGRQLHAFILPEKKVVTVQGRTNYANGRCRIKNKSILAYEIHPGVNTYS
jgi:calcineurin-like phosphoesterase family protein